MKAFRLDKPQKLGPGIQTLIVVAPTDYHARVLAKENDMSGISDEWLNHQITKCYEVSNCPEGTLMVVSAEAKYEYPVTKTDKQCALCDGPLFSCPSGLFCEKCGGGVPSK